MEIHDMLLLHIIIFLSPDSVRRLQLNDPPTFHCNNYFVIGGICTCLGVSVVECSCGFLRILVH